MKWNGIDFFGDSRLIKGRVEESIQLNLEKEYPLLV